MNWELNSGLADTNFLPLCYLGDVSSSPVMVKGLYLLEYTVLFFIWQSF